MSEFSVPVVAIGEVKKHDNADTLSITEVDGCPVIFRTGDFQTGDVAIYVPVDAVVPVSNPAFAFLATKDGQTTARVKAKRLRGIFSMGLLVKVTEAGLGDRMLVVGSDVATSLNIIKYEEPEPKMALNRRPGPKTRLRRLMAFLTTLPVISWLMRFGAFRRFMLGEKKPATPDIPCPIYDIESYRKYKGLLTAGTSVVVTEKIHGCNARFFFGTRADEKKPRLFIGSHRQFKPSDADSVWHDTAKKLDLASKLDNPLMFGRVLYGEVYGKVQDLKYGVTDEDPLRFAAFDIYDTRTGKFLDYRIFRSVCAILSIPTVPVLYAGPYDPEVVEPLARGKSTIEPKQIREGFVIKPEIEEYHPRHGRKIFKLVSEDYLLRKDGSEHH